MIDPFDPGEEILSIPELCGRLGVNRATIDRWRAAGKLHATRVGGRCFISKSSWDTFLEACNTPKPAAASARHSHDLAGHTSEYRQLLMF